MFALLCGMVMVPSVVAQEVQLLHDVTTDNGLGLSSWRFFIKEKMWGVRAA